MNRVGARHAVLGANFLVLGLNYADRAAIGVATPFIIEEFGFSTGTFAWILAVFGLSYAPFGFLGGLAADRFGPRRTMGWAVALWSVFTAATAAGVGMVSFLLIRLCFGAGEGPQATVTGKAMTNWFPQRELGAAIGTANAATPLGGALGTTIVAAILAATIDNWRVPFLLLGALGLLVAAGWFAVVRDHPDQHPWVSTAELATIRGTGNERATTGTWQTDEHQHGHDIRAHLARPIVWTTALAFFGYSWILTVFLTWFPTYLARARGIDLHHLAITGAIPWLCGFLGLIAGGNAIATRMPRSSPRLRSAPQARHRGALARSAAPAGWPRTAVGVGSPSRTCLVRTSVRWAPHRPCAAWC